MIPPSEHEAALLGMAPGEPIAERKARPQAMMAHRNIAGALDAGPTARLDLFIGSCQAIPPARRQGIINRPGRRQVFSLRPREWRSPGHASPTSQS